MNTAFVRDWPTSTRVAAGAFALVLFVDFGIAVHVPSAVAASTVAPLRVDTPPRIVLRAPGDVSTLYQALRRSPFDLPDSAPVAQVSLSLATPTIPATPADEPRLIGTVAQGANGGFVMVELPDKRVQLVHVGEQAGDLKLRSVSLGEASFDDANGKRVTLTTTRTNPDTTP